MDLAQGLLNDPSLVVRAVVAESLARQGTSKQVQDSSMEILIEISLREETPWGATMLALNALCDLGISSQLAAPIKEVFDAKVKSWNSILPERYSEYPARLVERLVETAK
jgi:hypothetical protein